MKHVCIHGHFYQPPRENPWLEEVERQDSAYPYHDWNERVTQECYAPNARARILGENKKISSIISNYAQMSFNFGPTLLSWMQKKEPEIYQAILDSDQEARKNFSGHGSAIAQAFNHLIMPLANSRDKYTQIYWGIRDFSFRFGRQPEGMWLPETAVDYETLDTLAGLGIKFTILAPRQARRIRRMDHGDWWNVEHETIDPRQPYLCRLPSGKTIVLFFYDGPVSRAVAFENLLVKGEHLADRLLSVFGGEDRDQLGHIATDGETYGHHHSKGDMALVYGLNYLQQRQLAKITVYAEYLEHHHPTEEVEIFENSSWSCVHGVERWRNDCGCHSGMHPGWHQRWRAPLRDCLNQLRDRLIQIYDQQMPALFSDPWQARNDYIDVILDRSTEKVIDFLSSHANHRLSHEERVRALKLLEMQRHSMLMFTSCGWFFDEVSGIETVQNLRYAARAIQLASEITSQPLEDDFLNSLQNIPSNLAQYHNAKRVYQQLVKPSIVDLTRVGAHYAINSLFEEYGDIEQIYCYNARREFYDLFKGEKNRLAIGKVWIHSNITGEGNLIVFAVLHAGDHHFFAGVKPFQNDVDFKRMHEDLQATFEKEDASEVLNLIVTYFEHHQYTLWHLFRDEQSKVLYQLLDTTLEDIDASLRRINEDHYSIIQVIKQLGIPLPKILVNTVFAALNTDLLRELGAERSDIERLKDLVSEVINWSLEIDKVTLEYLARIKISRLIRGFEKSPQDSHPLKELTGILDALQPLDLNINLWEAQNIFFSFAKPISVEIEQKQLSGDPQAQEWLDAYEQLAEFLNINVD